MRLFNFALSVSLAGVILLATAIACNVSYFKPVEQAIVAGGYQVQFNDAGAPVDLVEAPSTLFVVPPLASWTTKYVNNPRLQTDIEDYNQATYNPQEAVSGLKETVLKS